MKDRFKPLFLFLILIYLVGMCLPGQARLEEQVVFLQAVTNEKGEPIVNPKPGATGRLQLYPLMQEVPQTDERLPQLQKWLAQPHIQQNLWLGKVAKNYMDLDEPLYLHLVDGGNYPQVGFFLQTPTGVIDKSHVVYMSIAPNERFFTVTLPHENGHVMSFNLLLPLIAKLQDQNTLFPHTVTAVTTFLTAFSEGFGIHFETLAGDRETPELLADTFHRVPPRYQAQGIRGEYYFEAVDFLNYAQTYKRHRMVKDNRFIFRKVSESQLLLPQTRITPADLLGQWMSPLMNEGLLKTGQEMMASEGVCATLFYRLVMDHQLGETPLDPELLKQFGISEETLLSEQKVYLKIMVALSHLTLQDLNQGPTMLRFIQQLGKQFPTDRERVFSIFLETTKYATVSPEYRHLYEDLYHNAILLNDKNLEAIVPKIEELRHKSWKKSLDRPTIMEESVGPQIWLKFPQYTVDLPVLGLQKSALILELNTATYLQLAAIPGLSRYMAERIWQTREKQGFYRSLEELPVPKTIMELLQEGYQTAK